MSDENERELGFEFDRQAQQALPLVDDPVVLEFINDFGHELVERLGEQPFVYRFRVIANPN